MSPNYSKTKKSKIGVSGKLSDIVVGGSAILKIEGTSVCFHTEC